MLQVLVYNKRSTKVGFAFVVLSMWKNFEKNPVPMRKILVKDKQKFTIFFILAEALWELKYAAVFRCFLIFFLFSKKSIRPLFILRIQLKRGSNANQVKQNQVNRST